MLIPACSVLYYFCNEIQTWSWHSFHILKHDYIITILYYFWFCRFDMAWVCLSLEVVKNSSKVGLGDVDLMKCMCGFPALWLSLTLTDFVFLQAVQGHLNGRKIFVSRIHWPFGWLMHFWGLLPLTLVQMTGICSPCMVGGPTSDISTREGKVVLQSQHHIHLTPPYRWKEQSCRDSKSPILSLGLLSSFKLGHGSLRWLSLPWQNITAWTSFSHLVLSLCFHV